MSVKSFVTNQQVDVNKGCLPSPEELKYKILFKAKKSKKKEKIENENKSRLNELGTSEEKVMSEATKKEGSALYEEHDENRLPDKSRSNRSFIVSNESSKDECTASDENVKDIVNETVGGQLNSLINCLEATKFVQLDDPERKFWQMFSLKEQRAENLGNKHKSAMKLVCLTQKNLARVYPGSTRLDSSNFSPIPFWLR